MSVNDLVLLSALVLAFALISQKIQGTILTAPLLAVLAGGALGKPGADWLSLSFSEPLLHTLSEVTLVFVLFGDATRINLSALKREPGLPLRLLGGGLPFTMAIGGGAAYFLVPQLSFWEAMTLGAVLAPTDAALGQAVVSSPAVPMRIRQALNVESGLNDGIALPFVLLFASWASAAAGETRTTGDWVQFTALQVTLGPLAGVLIAWGGGWLIDRGIRRGAVDASFERITGLALPLLCYAGAELVHGNGFIAAFVGGVTFGTTQKDRCHSMLSFLEAEGQLLMLLVFFGLGATLAVPALLSASGSVILYAFLSLTLVRMIPVSLSLWGTKLRAPTHVFLGWFGPRGLASLLYAILLVSQGTLPNEEALLHAVVLTSLLSILLHGVTAAPGAATYGRLAGDPSSCPMEHLTVEAHPVRGHQPNNKHDP